MARLLRARVTLRPLEPESRFVAGRVLFGRPRYDDHGEGRRVCSAVVLDAERFLAAGKTIEQARAEIDRFYSAYARYATETTQPPHRDG